MEKHAALFRVGKAAPREPTSAGKLQMLHFGVERAFLKTQGIAEQSQEAFSLQLVTSSIKGLHTFVKTHSAAMATIAGSLAFYKNLTLGSLVVTVFSGVAVTSSNKDISPLFGLIFAISAFTFIISGYIWRTNSSVYSYHANLQQQALAIIELKTKQLNGA